MSELKLNETYDLPDGKWKLVQFCDEPNTGLCILEPVDPPRGINMAVPVAWIDALLADPTVRECKRCRFGNLTTYCDECGHEQ